MSRLTHPPSTHTPAVHTGSAVLVSSSLHLIAHTSPSQCMSRRERYEAGGTQGAGSHRAVVQIPWSHLGVPVGRRPGAQARGQVPVSGTSLHWSSLVANGMAGGSRHPAGRHCASLHNPLSQRSSPYGVYPGTQSSAQRAPCAAPAHRVRSADFWTTGTFWHPAGSQVTGLHCVPKHSNTPDGRNPGSQSRLHRSRPLHPSRLPAAACRMTGTGPHPAG
mmetsp:Transcript_21491/g.54942  ORF Transcript_21491/g.54942 Transcript_21491/m.54942 type:complete len:219 (-) Transcript_21491:726-1382(-)